MESERIKLLDKLIQTFRGDEIQIVDKKITNLTAPGENYLSDLLKLDLTIRNKDGTENIEHLVAKCILLVVGFPPEMSHAVFKNEYIFYKEVIPSIKNFSKERGLIEKDIFPEMLAGRLNLEDEGSKIDENAVLILENLSEKGYRNFDRHKSFDLSSAKVILSDMATFHAVPLAMRILDLELFKQKIAENCKRPDFVPDDKNKKPPPSPSSLLLQTAKEDKFCSAHIKKLEKMVKNNEENMKANVLNKPDYSSPFLTLCHNDMWLNNTMQLIKDEQVIKNKFVDFQMCSLGEPTTDLIFFLFSSVNLPTIENHFDYLLMYYHECFIKTLEQFKCDVTLYSYEKFMEKVKEAVLSTFMQIMVMNFLVIYGKKGEKTDFFKLDQIKSSELHPIAKKKFIYLFRKIIENDWF